MVIVVGISLNISEAVFRNYSHEWVLLIIEYEVWNFDYCLIIDLRHIVCVGPVDILEHNLKLVLGLVWTLIQRYQLGIGAAQREEPSKPGDGKKPTKKKPSASAKKLLLNWVTATLPDMEVKNLTTNWNDGTRLSALVDNLKPGLIPNHASLDPNNAIGNTRNAMDLAEEHFGIPQVSCYSG